MRRYAVTAAAAVVLLTGNAECENVETCTPTRVEIEREADVYVVRLHSGDQALRGREVRVQAAGRDGEHHRRDVEVDERGEARVGIPAAALEASSQVRASFRGDRTFCPAADGTDDGTGPREGAS